MRGFSSKASQRDFRAEPLGKLAQSSLLSQLREKTCPEQLAQRNCYANLPRELGQLAQVNWRRETCPENLLSENLPRTRFLLSLSFVTRQGGTVGAGDRRGMRKHDFSSWSADCAGRSQVELERAMGQNPIPPVNNRLK